MLQIYNTLTRVKEDFKPIVKNHVSMYVCGPTVYNYIHIGNARSIVAFDTIRRYLAFCGYHVDFVSNFTDVDDKMIRAAKEDGITVETLADKYINAFKQDTAALNVLPATKNPRATDYIPQIIQFIEVLIKKGSAYAVDGDVYYRTRQFPNYGQLSDQNIDELEEGASNHLGDEEQKRKEDPIDFALWKGQKEPSEIAWDSPWGKGRPGWHIECSVMATNELGATIDIHGGGQDLEFPHHENEIAQSEAETGQKFVNYWMHNGFVTVGDDDEKMSKSLGNFVTVHELLETIDPKVLRFALVTTQYRKPLHYNKATLEDAKNNLDRLKIAYDNLIYRKETAQPGSTTEIESAGLAIKSRFIEAMDDDFNIQNAITQLFELVKLINIYSEDQTVYEETVEALLSIYSQLLAVLGITFQTELLDADIENLIQQRLDARTNKDFQKSDAIRDELKDKGIILEDTAQGTRWRRQ